MKRGLILAIFVVFLIPSVASAAWWNPFSWKVFSKIFSPQPTSVQIEKTPEVDDTQGQTSEIEKLKEEIEILKTQVSEDEQETTSQTTKSVIQGTSQKSVVTPTVQQTNLLPVGDSNVSFNDLLKKYTDFKSYLENERKTLSKNSQYLSEREYYKYVDDLLTRTSGDLGYLYSIQYWNPRPAIESTYLIKFNGLKNEYSKEASIYPNELHQDKMQTAKNNVVNYIYDNKSILYQADIHIKAATLLYIFDQLFDTKYSPDFESKKTQQENIEFANRFLIDQGVDITD